MLEMMGIRTESLKAGQNLFDSVRNLHYPHHPLIPVSAVLNNAEASHVR